MEVVTCFCSKCKAVSGRFKNSWNGIGKTYFSPVHSPLSTTGLKPEGEVYQAAQIENSFLQDLACQKCGIPLGFRCDRAPEHPFLVQNQLILRLSDMSVRSEGTGAKVKISVLETYPLINPKGKRLSEGRRESTGQNTPRNHPPKAQAIGPIPPAPKTSVSPSQNPSWGPVSVSQGKAPRRAEYRASLAPLKSSLPPHDNKSVPRPKPEHPSVSGSSLQRSIDSQPQRSSSRTSGGPGRDPGRWPKGTKKSDFGGASSSPGLPPGLVKQASRVENEVPLGDEKHQEDEEDNEQEQNGSVGEEDEGAISVPANRKPEPKPGFTRRTSTSQNLASQHPSPSVQTKGISAHKKPGPKPNNTRKSTTSQNVTSKPRPKPGPGALSNPLGKKLRWRSGGPFGGGRSIEVDSDWEEAIKAHQNDINRISEAVLRIEKDIEIFKFFITDIRTKLSLDRLKGTEKTGTNLDKQFVGMNQNQDKTSTAIRPTDQNLDRQLDYAYEKTRVVDELKKEIARLTGCLKTLEQPTQNNGAHRSPFSRSVEAELPTNPPKRPREELNPSGNPSGSHLQSMLPPKRRKLSAQLTTVPQPSPSIRPPYGSFQSSSSQSQAQPETSNKQNSYPIQPASISQPITSDTQNNTAQLARNFASTNQPPTEPQPQPLIPISSTPSPILSNYDESKHFNYAEEDIDDDYRPPRPKSRNRTKSKNTVEVPSVKTTRQREVDVGMGVGVRTPAMELGGGVQQSESARTQSGSGSRREVDKEARVVDRGLLRNEESNKRSVNNNNQNYPRNNIHDRKGGIGMGVGTPSLRIGNQDIGTGTWTANGNGNRNAVLEGRRSELIPGRNRRGVTYC